MKKRTFNAISLAGSQEIVKHVITCIINYIRSIEINIKLLVCRAFVFIETSPARLIIYLNVSNVILTFLRVEI